MKDIQNELNRVLQCTAYCAEHKNELKAKYKDLEDFYKKTHSEWKNQNTVTSENQQLYMKWIKEETTELLAEKPCTPNHFKELCDVIWVCIQEANACGYDLEAGLGELAEEYVSKFADSEGKFNPTFREDGKLMKGIGFKKANFEQFFERKDEE